MKKLIVFLLSILIVISSFAEAKIDISGSVEWDTMLIKALVSLDLASAGVRLPSGRPQGETLLSSSYNRLIRPSILDLQVDSSSTIRDLINRGEFSLLEMDNIANKAHFIPPALSSDMLNMISSYTVTLTGISSALLRHNRIIPVMRTLNPVSSARYTGIVIIAAEELPAHGMRSTALPVPCLFPKIWDNNMNLIYERGMLTSRDTGMVRYSPLRNIFQNTPSGLTPELEEIVGDRPLRIFARGVYGINPTDLIIDVNDALMIISSEENQKLLSQGKVVIVLDDSVLRKHF
jgi:hypothetical protein